MLRRRTPFDALTPAANGAPDQPLRVLVSMASQSRLLSLRLALDAHGIRYIHTSEHVTNDGVLKYPNAILVSESDFEDASAAIQDVTETSYVAWSSRELRIVTLLCAAVILFWALLIVVR